MFIDNSANKVDLVKRCNWMVIWKFNAWMVFDHVNCVKEWNTMVCHIYDPIYYKIMTNAIYGM